MVTSPAAKRKRNHPQDGGLGMVSTSDLDGAAPSRGRPRDPDTAALILSAALEELKTSGYSGMSMQTIADRAGVTKPTIYRRWPGKQAVAAVAELLSHEADVDTTDVRKALHRELESIHANLQKAGQVSLLGTLIAERDRDPEFLDVYREIVFNVRVARMVKIIEAGVGDGRIRPDADVASAVHLLLGFPFTNYFSNDDERKAGWLLSAVDVVLSGISA
jgi:AcrR family transcriptional regulator